MLRRLLVAAISTAIALGASALPAGAQYGPATAAGVNADQAAAQRRVMMDALQGGGNHGGCTPLPSGWSSLSARVNFPDAYGGYGGWVNMAELLPTSQDLAGFLKSHSGGPFNRTAGGTSSAVHTELCAPAGFSYWLIVDSGTAKVAVGRVTLSQPGHAYHVTLTAPPLGSTPSSSTPTDSGATSPNTATGASANTPQSPVATLSAELHRRVVQAPLLGMAGINMNDTVWRLLGVTESEPPCVFITSIDRGGLVQRLGLQRFDCIFKLNGQSVASIRDLAGSLATTASGSPPAFQVLRNKTLITVTAPASNQEGWIPPVVGPGYVPPGASTPAP
ncbi:PDZ domain-containing protein [bacterium]|nr:MAG: PDZ domain-containing protein [bacterium]